MGRLVALLRDAFHESVDQKIFTILLILSLVLLAAVASLRFDPLPPAEQVPALLAGVMDEVFIGPRRVSLPDPRPEATGITGNGTLRFHLRFKAPRAWARLKKRARLPADDAAALAALFRLQGGEGIRVAPLGEGRFLVEIPREAAFTLPGGTRLSLFFGLVRISHPVNAAMVLFGIAAALIKGIAGFIGVAVALVATAGFVPQLLRPGRMAFLLARPVSRWLFLVGRYLGGLSFVALVGGLVIVGLWVIMGVFLGRWSPWPLVALPGLLGYYGVLYAVSVFLGVLTRSTLATILLTFFFWIGVSSLHNAYHLLTQAGAELGLGSLPAWVMDSLEVLHRLLPRTDALDGVMDYAIARAYLTPGVREAMVPPVVARGELPEVLAVTLFFVAAVLGLAWLRLRRLDL